MTKKNPENIRATVGAVLGTAPAPIGSAAPYGARRGPIKASVLSPLHPSIHPTASPPCPRRRPPCPGSWPPAASAPCRGAQGSRSLSRAPGTAWSCPQTSNWHCVSVSGWKCPINPRSQALFWISVIPYSTTCIKMRTVMELWGGLSSFSGLEMEELLKAVTIVACDVHGFIHQFNDLVYIKERYFPLHWLSIM
nr:uncharacterized protein LOC115496113 [Taeniopygia guttata]